MRQLSAFTLVSFAFIIMLLSGCGGGGGGGVIGGSGLSVNTSAISFNAIQNGARPASQTYSISWTGANVAQVIVGVPPNETIPSWVNVNLGGSTSPLTLTLDITDTSMAPATYTFTMRIITADVQNQALDIVDIPVSYVIDNAVVANPSSISFSTVAGIAPNAQTLTLSQAGNAVTPTSVTTSIQASWLQVSINGNTVTVDTNNNVLSLIPGLYQGVATVNYIAGGGLTGSVNVSVSLIVSMQSLAASNNPLFSLDNNSVSGDLSQVISISTNVPGNPSNVTWTATESTPWFTVSPSSGDTSTNNNLTITIDPAQLGSLANKDQAGQVINHQGQIVLTSGDPGYTLTTVTVTLNLDLPFLKLVSPNVGQVNASREVIIRGEGFLGLTTETVMFGGQPAVSQAVMSDSEIRATFPAQAAGSYDVTVSNALGVTRTAPKLNIVAAPAYASEAIATTGQKSRIIYDTVRAAIYVANTGNNTLDRYVYNSAITTGSKWVASNLSVANVTALSDIGLSVDGSYILMVDNSITGRHVEVDPATLAIINNATFGGFNGIVKTAFTSGGEAILARRETQSNNQTTSLRVKQNAAGGLISPLLRNAAVGATRDGRRALLSSNDETPATDIYYYDSGDYPDTNPATLTSTSIRLNANAISSDRVGTRWILNQTEVYDGTGFAYTGSLPVTTDASLLSHDGNTAYTMDSNGTLRKFDMTSVTANQFTEIGTGTSLVASPGNNPVMTLSHDGSLLFIVGDSNLVIDAAP